MNHLSFAVSLLLLSCLSGQAHSQDSANYTLLKNGQKIYSDHLRLRHTPTADQYLTLDNNRQIPIEEVDRFHSSQGTFVTIPGSAGTDIYRVEREGAKISLYSKLFIDPYHLNDSGYTPTRQFFFRKAEQEKMKAVTIPGLRDAMADNPASLHQIDVARTNLTVGLTTSVVSALLEFVGFYLTAKGHSHQETVQPTYPTTYPVTYPFFPPPTQQLPPLQTTVTTHPVSPLVYIGGGGIIGGLILAFGAPHHALKAFDIYNQ